MVTEQSTQKSLFDSHPVTLTKKPHRVADTSVEALKAVRPKNKGRKLAIENHLLVSGHSGLTRHELAIEMSIPLSSVCGLVRSMLDSKAILEPGARRETPNGQMAKVLILPQFMEVHAHKTNLGSLSPTDHPATSKTTNE